MKFGDFRRNFGQNIAIVGIPKTIDNDIGLIDRCETPTHTHTHTHTLDFLRWWLGTFAVLR